MLSVHSTFISLVRLGLGIPCLDISSVNWANLYALSKQHGLSAIVLDGIGELKNKESDLVGDSLPPQKLILPWIGEVMQVENIYAAQQKAAIEMSQWFHDNNIKTYVLKGTVISECYPQPNHRLSVDMDSYLLPVNGDFDAWDLGNNLIARQGKEVNYDFYKNSTFLLPGLTVENHKYFTPFRGNKRLQRLEKYLHSLMLQDKSDDSIEDTWLYRPPVMVTALFLIEHAYSHFLHEGLTWRHVLDWMMYSKKHHDEIDWKLLDSKIYEYGFRKFYESYIRLGHFLLGELEEKNLTKQDRLMMDDIWAPLDLHESVRGLKGKLALAGNTWRARWKYRQFSDINWLQALWIQAKGFLFEKNPKLNRERGRVPVSQKN